MHFYLVAFKIVPPNACMENYQNKSSIKYFKGKVLGAEITLHHYCKNKTFDKKNVTEFLVVSYYGFYYFFIIQ